ncbi:hypothetical protein Tco_0168989 [Tanacetum coccineum]
MAGLHCNKFRRDKGKIILVLPIRVMLQIQGEIIQVGRKELLNATTAKEKAMLAEAQEAGQILDEEQLEFLADLGIPASQAQTVIPHIATFQTEDLDTYDSDCDDLSTAQAVLMANISNYGSYVVSKGKKLVENAVHIPSATTISPDMFKLDLVPLPPSRKQAKAKKPLDGGLKLACRMPQEFRVLVSVFQDTSGSVSPVIADKEPPEQ